ncbi:MAG: hypothetical protein ABUS79_10675 [Pseudomonadota bacterium]
MGFGFAHYTAATDITELELSGSGLRMSLALGRALSSNVILYGQFLAQSISNPTVKVDGLNMGSTSSGGVDLIGFGPGLAYYFTESNIFVAETVALSQVSGNDGFLVARESRWGASFTTFVGKEWWVSTNWGLGVSAQFTYGRIKGERPPFMPDNAAAPTWTTMSAGLLFSASYN